MLAEKSTIGDILLWGSVLIGGVIALGVIIQGLRRWALKPSEEATQDEWSLQHLRDLKAQGLLTEQEFADLKAKTLKQYQRGDQTADDASNSRSTTQKS